MAIIKKATTTIDSIIPNKNTDLGNSLENSEKKDSKKAQTKKGNFLSDFFATTIQELKLVDWPKFDYILRSAFVIIIFTLAFSLLLGSLDYFFAGLVKFVGCTSPKDQATTVGACAERLGNYLLFRGF